MKNLTKTMLFALFILTSANLFSNIRIEKVGLVDMNRIMDTAFSDSSPVFREIRDRTQALNTYLNQIRDRIMVLEEQKLSVTDNARKLELQTQIDDLKKHYRDYYQLHRYQIQQLRESAQEPIIGEIKEVIRVLCVREGYTLIIDVTESSIIYYTPESDITNKVIELINTRRTH